MEKVTEDVHFGNPSDEMISNVHKCDGESQSEDRGMTVVEMVQEEEEEEESSEESD